MNPQAELDLVAAQVAACAKCPLQHSRKLAVPGEGPPDSEIMCIGEGPGFHENEQGRPFVGAAGKFLDELLAAAGLKRSQVWIGNVVKCRPPGNRDPLPEELAACNEYLERQIRVINPSIIITLGRFSMTRFLPGSKISAVHGQMTKVADRYVIAMFHPAAALHQASLKPSIIADFAKLPQLLDEARRGLGRPRPDSMMPAAPSEDEPKQLSMF